MIPTKAEPVLPSGTRLLHIGPHKTGTTAVQSAFHLGRRAAAARGVRYAGPGRTPTAAAQAAVARKPDALKPWEALLREVRAAREPRIVISSEWFSDAQDAAIAQIVRELDPAQIHVVITLRPLARILPSQWQQFVQGDSTTDYATFLEALFRDEDTPDVKRFWHRHGHGALVERWARGAGASNVTVIVASDRDHGAVLRGFEALTGLPTGSLVGEDARRNRSLTWPETEVVRAVNRRLMAERLPGKIKQGLVLFGAAPSLRRRRPADGEPAIETPAWAIDRASEVAREEAARIAASGVRVIGDLVSLSAVSIPEGPVATGASEGFGAPVPDAVWADIAGSAALGVLRATGLTRAEAKVNASALGAIPTWRLVGVIAGRLRDRRPSLGPVVASPAAQAPTEAPADPRPLTNGATSSLADPALSAFERAFRGAGFGDALYRSLRDDIAAELASTAPGTWPEAAGAIAVGIARAAGFISGGHGRRQRPRRAAIEVPEVVEVSSVRLGLAIAERVIHR